MTHLSCFLIVITASVYARFVICNQVYFTVHLYLHVNYADLHVIMFA